MDFRSVTPSSLTWSTLSRGQPVARTPQGGKVVVQTPTCPCRVSMHSPGMFRIDMSLRAHVPIHAAFMDWVSDIEESATEHLRIPKMRSSCVYNGNLRLMAFSDTLAFDASGSLSADLMSAAACACVVELQGCWTTDQKWGLRWKVVQVKFTHEAPALPPAPGEEDEAPATGAGFAFVEDA